MIVHLQYFKCTAKWFSFIYIYLCVCVCVCVLVAQLCPTFHDPIVCTPPGSSVHGILQAGILVWVAFPVFRGSSRPRDRTQVSYVSSNGRQVLYHLSHQVAQVAKNPTTNTGDLTVAVWILGWGRSPLGGHSNPLQFSCLENPMDRGAWWASVHSVAQSRT